jgi:hypothetical protein
MSSRSPPVLPQTPWRDRVFLEIDQSLARLQWDIPHAQRYLSTMFPGYTSRRQLSDFQLTLLNRRLDWDANTLAKIKETNENSKI